MGRARPTRTQRLRPSPRSRGGCHHGPLAAVPGTAGTATLENENGNVVYSVIVTTSTGAVDVKVDAGNGKVLAQDAGGNETEGGSSETANG